MARELIFKSLGKRDWSRGHSPASVSGDGPFKKSVLGAMVLGTVASLAIITSALWSPRPKRRDPRREPGRQRIMLIPKDPSKQVIWSRR